MNPASLKRNEFIKIFGSLYENSAFIAEEIFQIGVKKDHSYEDVLISMRAFVDEMKPKAKLQLILEHPELGIRKHEASNITKHSQIEQKGAGLDRLDKNEFQKLKSLNTHYKEKFNFPFIIAVTGLTKHEIFRNIEKRIENNADQEFETAVNEIHKIAKIRLEKLI